MSFYPRKFNTVFLSILVTFVFFAAIELLSRSLNLTGYFDSDFRFYIRKVDGDVSVIYNIEDALLMWSPKPNFTSGKVKINSQGFRDKEYKIEKEKNTFRILCLGDSSTFHGKYHSLLEKKLNRDFKSHDVRFEVINAGVTGYTSYQGLCMYKYRGARYNPDIVTFYFGINDPIKRFYLSDKEILQGGDFVTLKIVKNRFLLKSHLYRLLRKFIHTIIGKDKRVHRENVPRVSIKDFRENIIELNELSKKDNFILILISPPCCKERMPGWPRSADIILYRKELEHVANEYGIPLIEIKEMTERSEFPTLDYFKDTVHPHELGHRMIMQKLYDYLVTNNLLPVN